MSALYQIRYQGVAGHGHGALYIGKGSLIGIDVTGSRYSGSYTSQDGRLVGSALLTASGSGLVTGQVVPANTVVSISFDLQSDFDNGQFQVVVVGNQRVSVAFDKVGDIP